MPEFEDEFEEFEDEFEDDFDDSWEDYVEEEPDFGAKYIPAPTSINFEKYAIFASFIMILASCYFIYVQVLGEVYDTTFGGPTWFEKLENQEVIEAQPRVEILGIGKYNPEDKSDNYDYAILNAGTRNGLSEGMIFYFETLPDFDLKTGYWEETKMLKKAKNPKLLIIRKADLDLSWAEFCEWTTDVAKSIPDRVNVVQMPIQAYREDPTPDIPLPAYPRKSKKLQYFAWEEAMDISGEIERLSAENKRIPPGLDAYIGYRADSVVSELKVIRKLSEPDKVDPNPRWSILRRVSLNYKEILDLVQGNKDSIIASASEILLGDDRTNIKDAVVVFKSNPLVYLAPSNDQRVFQDIYLRMKDN